MSKSPVLLLVTPYSLRKPAKRQTQRQPLNSTHPAGRADAEDAGGPAHQRASDSPSASTVIAAPRQSVTFALNSENATPIIRPTTPERQPAGEVAHSGPVLAPGDARGQRDHQQRRQW